MDCQPTDDRNFDLMLAQRSESLSGGSEAEVDLDERPWSEELAQDPRNDVGPRRAGRAEAEGARFGLDEGAHPPIGLLEQSIGARDVLGKESTRWSERKRRSAVQERHTHLTFQGGDVLRHRWLAEVQPFGRSDERAGLRHSEERA